MSNQAVSPQLPPAGARPDWTIPRRWEDCCDIEHRTSQIFGAGIVSSSGESDYALHSAAPLRIGFDLRRVMRSQEVV